MKRLNVLMITSLLPHQDAVQGGAVVMHGQLRTLAESHHVTLVSLSEDEPSERAGASALRASGVDLHCVWRPGRATLSRWVDRGRLAWRWLCTDVPLRSLAFHRTALQREVTRLIHERVFDVIQVEDSAMAAYDFPAGVPVVLTEHEVRAPETDRLPFAGPAKRLAREEQRRWIDFQRGAWAGATVIQVFTPRDAEAIAAIEPAVAGRVRINPFGVALPMVRRSASEEGLVVFVGGFQHPPNVDAAVWLADAIMPRLRDRAAHARLLIVGSDPPRRVRALARDDVEVTGRVPDVAPFLERAAVVVAPIRTGGGMRLKVLQAMAAGKAVVATSLGAEGLMGGEDRPLVIADDEESISREIAALLSDPERRDALGARARKYVEERYGWPAYKRRLEDLYEEVLPLRNRMGRSTGGQAV